jgi:hypothetical protein
VLLAEDLVSLREKRGLTGTTGHPTPEKLDLCASKDVYSNQRWSTREQLLLAIITWIERIYHRRRSEERVREVTLVQMLPIRFLAAVAYGHVEKGSLLHRGPPAGVASLSASRRSSSGPTGCTRGQRLHTRCRCATQRARPRLAREALIMAVSRCEWGTADTWPAAELASIAGRTCSADRLRSLW